MERYHCFIIEGGSIYLPVTPKVSSWSKGIGVETINISQVGDVYRPGKPTRRRGKIEGFFPARDYSWLAPGARTDPYWYVELFSALAHSETVVRYLVTGTEINAQVLVENIEYQEKDASGDVYYTLSLAEWVDLEAVTVSELDTSAWTGNAGQSQSAGTGAQQYTIVSGDMLSVICRRFYGNGSATYYNALAAYNNIANPHLIHPGATITIPPVSELLGG